MIIIFDLKFVIKLYLKLFCLPKFQVQVLTLQFVNINFIDNSAYIDFI